MGPDIGFKKAAVETRRAIRRVNRAVRLRDGEKQNADVFVRFGCGRGGCGEALGARRFQCRGSGGNIKAVDMAAIGDGQTSDEFHPTLCVKDSGGPYHHGLSNHLRKLAEQHEIPYKVDIYPYYGSDGEAYWRAGGDVKVALIGPGVDASHNYERTHMDALMGTTKWVLAYLFH